VAVTRGVERLVSVVSRKEDLWRTADILGHLYGRNTDKRSRSVSGLILFQTDLPSAFLPLNPLLPISPISIAEPSVFRIDSDIIDSNNSQNC